VTEGCWLWWLKSLRCVLQMSRLKAARATERMREMVGENGPCSELAACLVPLPLKPEVLLEGLLTQVGLVCGGVWSLGGLGGEGKGC
jgi:hypothetical protein